jgi:type IV pilus assembly protein PilW
MFILQIKTGKVHSFQAGLSLVELMIAMVISLLLLGGLVQIVVSNKQTYNFQQSQALNQENSRYSYFYLDDIVNKAGYRTIPQDGVDVTFEELSANASCAQFNRGQIVAASNEGTGICIRYQRAAAMELDCSGNVIATATPIVTRIFFDQVTQALVCGAQGGQATTMVENIDNLQIQYGVDSGSGNLAFVAVPPNWNNIRAVRIALLTASENQVLDGAQSYAFPVDTATLITATDRRAYRSSQKTIHIRNAILN